MDFDKLSDNLKEAIGEMTDYDMSEIELLTKEDCLNLYLQYNVIIGYTSQIMSVIKELKINENGQDN